MRAGAAQLGDDVLRWLLDGDVAVQFQTRRDLLDEDRPDLQARIATEGVGAAILALARQTGAEKSVAAGGLHRAQLAHRAALVRQNQIAERGERAVRNTAEIVAVGREQPTATRSRES